MSTETAVRPTLQESAVKQAIQEIKLMKEQLLPPIYKSQGAVQYDVALNELNPIEGAPGTYRFRLYDETITVKKAPGFPETATSGDIHLCASTQDITFKRLGKDVTYPMGTKAFRLLAKA